MDQIRLLQKFKHVKGKPPLSTDNGTDKVPTRNIGTQTKQSKVKVAVASSDSHGISVGPDSMTARSQQEVKIDVKKEGQKVVGSPAKTLI